MNYFSALIFLPALLLSSVGLQAAAVPDVARRDPGPAPSNQKQVDAGGLPVVGSTNVSDFAKAPRFRWRKEPVPENPRVLIQTAMGEIEVGLDRNRAPVSVTNFLHYVHEGLYSDGGFHRTVTLANQAASAVKIQVIQAAANSAKSNEFLRRNAQA